MLSQLFIILNLIVIECVLSVDNASALAAMVGHLPEKQRNKALRYGLLGAYLFRGTSLFMVSFLMKLLWLKIAGGVYLLYLTYDFFKEKADDDGVREKIKGKTFWMTVLSVEILDMSLSIDNVFAAVALSNNIYLILTGIFIGILAMRFIAGWFVKLIAKHPYMESAAFVIIALLGLKLIVSGILEYMPEYSEANELIKSHSFDLGFSLTMLCILFVPMLKKSNN
jgi:YkoY family integral membrane protein